LIGNNVQHGDGSSSTASAWLLRLVKNGTAGPVVEVDENNGVLLGEPGFGMAEE
jgi:hypothetical protein